MIGAETKSIITSITCLRILRRPGISMRIRRYQLFLPTPSGLRPSRPARTHHPDTSMCTPNPAATQVKARLSRSSTPCRSALTAEAASSSHPCSDWFQTSPLTPSGDTAVSAINKLLTNNSTTDPINRFGHGTFNYVDSSGNITGVDTMTGAVFGQRNVGEGAPTIKKFPPTGTSR